MTLHLADAFIQSDVKSSVNQGHITNNEHARSGTIHIDLDVRS